MADQNITELPIKTNSGVASTDYMLGIDSAEGYQILVRDVAKYIVENYNGSTIFGSAQTVKNAFAGTLSKMQVFPVNETNGRLEYLNDATFSFANAVREWMLVKGVDAPTTADFWYLHTFAYTKDANGHVTNGKQIAYGYGSKASEVYQRTCSSGTWTDWEKQPTRAEITELNSNTITKPTVQTEHDDLNNLITPGFYFTQNATIVQNAPQSDAYNSAIVVMRARTNDIIQFFISTNKRNIWWRVSQYSGSNWSNWFKISQT